ncbi:GTA-gp10 family protein [Sphingomonas sp. HITSZ_GF]|uniref:GTA-gp10 family protein n=1 Tax=Sphingomonas sp. HITSZ_GF TaxID=3037247 RepID=UPI00240DF638|nr:GTA-gp10 family protein [Sphingomonas sp. HITSZ_GF]MDG2534479.1 GTA-gp10 family protein [Sphingomonas sp. HITSZ_GF]
MTGAANPERGEAALVLEGITHVLRPSFQALVAAEGELGPLFELVERAASGRLGIAEIAGLFWHCLKDPPAIDRVAFSEALVSAGLKALTPALRVLIGQILAGR